MIIKSLAIALGICFALPFGLQAQLAVEEGDSFKDRVFTGGGLGFSVNNVFSSFSVSPIVGYQVSNNFSAGIGGTYQINSFRNVDLRFTNYGARLFGRYNFTEEFFAYTEYEYLNFEFLANQGQESVREGFNSYFVGGGYSIPVGNRAAITAIALYNVAHVQGNSPYPSPLIFRAGITASPFR